MKQNLTISIESINVTVNKIPVSVKDINLGASCEYTPEEMSAEGSVMCQVIDQLAEKLSWLKPMIERKINIELHNDELFSKDLEKQIQEGTTRAYGPHGWSVRTSDLHDTKPAVPDNKKK